MILEQITEQLTETLKTRVLTLFGHAIDRVVLQAPPKLAMGDLATPVCLELAKALTKEPKCDYDCWDLYSRMASHYAENPDSQQWRRDTLHRIERGEGDTAKLGALIARAVVRKHIDTMLRLGITYDLLPKESDII